METVDFNIIFIEHWYGNCWIEKQKYGTLEILLSQNFVVFGLYFWKKWREPALYEGSVACLQCMYQKHEYENDLRISGNDSNLCSNTISSYNNRTSNIFLYWNIPINVWKLMINEILFTEHAPSPVQGIEQK